MDENVNHGGEKSPVAAAVLGAELAPTVPSDVELSRLRCHDLGNGQRLRERRGHDLAFVAEWGGWLTWNGKYWDRDRGAGAARLASFEVAEKIYDEADVLEKWKNETDEDFEKREKGFYAWARTSCSKERTAAMLNVAEPRLERELNDFDSRDDLIAVQNGTLHVKSAAKIEFYPHQRSDMNSRICAVDYDQEADCPKWRRQVAEVITNDDTALYYQKVLGYALSGSIAHQYVHFFVGNGSDGKSTNFEVICKVLGSYAMTVGVETFLHDANRSSSGPSPDTARLPGVRLLRTSEPEIGARLSESRIKQWTGGENMTTRKLRADIFEFKPRGKLFISMNAKPVIVGKDWGIKRRIRIVPFNRQFGKEEGTVVKDQDTLVNELLEERDGIFNWLLDGLRMVLDEGQKAFDPPPEVRAATKAYFAEQDPIGQCIEQTTYPVDILDGMERHEYESDGKILYEVYVNWCKGAGEKPRSETAFGRRLSDLNYIKRPSNGRIMRQGIKVHPEWNPAASMGVR